MKKDFSEFKKFVNGRKIAVVGIGISNIPLIKFLVELGAHVTAFDKKDREKLGEKADEFEKMGVKLELGESYLDNLTGFDIVFKTPSMRIDCDALVKAAREGAYITSEMEEFTKYCKAKIFAVTGSDGKTTTTTIISKLLMQQGHKVWVGGNIGTPLFAHIEEIGQDDMVVLELSSFQLMTMDTEMDVAVVTNLSPNHLDIHKNMKEYIEAKKNIFTHQTEADLLVVNRENEITYGFEKEAKGKVVEFSSKRKIKNGAYYEDGKLYVHGEYVCDAKDIVIKGMHNVENYLAAFNAVYGTVSVENMKKVAETFGGVEHRCEFIRELKGVRYYNDSIASSPTRTLAGLKAFDQKVILIAGGYDKHLSFEPLAREGYSKIKHLVLVGLTKEKIKHEFDLLKNEGINVPITMADSFEDAVTKAESIAEKGDIVTLSPACASFDMFPNFEVRGNKFKELVNSL